VAEWMLFNVVEDKQMLLERDLFVLDKIYCPRTDIY
jgi:hypothetical protein